MGTHCRMTLKVSQQRLTAICAMFVCWLGIGLAALAQPTDSTPPIFSAVDERGVDLISGRMTYFYTPAISIGQPGQGGLSYQGFAEPWFYRDNLTGTISGSGSVRRVSIGTSTESFSASGSNWISAQATGSTLTFNAGTQEWTYTMGDGSIAKFSRTLGQMTTRNGAQEGLITSLTAPDGMVTTFHYRTLDVLYCPIPGGGCVPGIGGGTYELLERLVRLQSVTNTAGYQIQFKYRANWFGSVINTIDFAPWMHIESVTALNNTEEYCPPLASCTLTGTWPTLSFANTPRFWSEVTDSLGRTTYITSVSNTFSYRPPGAAAPVISAAISPSTWRISSVTMGASTWNYAYADASGQRTTTITNPGGSTRILVSSLTTGLPISDTNELSKTTSLTHDSNGRVTQITYPEGNKVQYTYDGRGNVTELRQVAKSGSGLADLVQSASYPGTCSNAKTCNKPTWTKDSAGQQTDYTYDSTHGGVLTITQPAAAAGGTRPQQRLSYAQMYAWYKQSVGGAVAQAPSQVWRLTQTSACSSGTSPGCLGTAAETRTTLGYGAAGVGNNRLPLIVTAANGSGTVTSAMARTLTPASDVATVDGPLSGTTDTSYYFYDAMRNPLGVITPDPDAGGALLRRAVKLSYNAYGLVSAADQGTATGVNLAALTGMSSLLRTETDYDDLLRPTTTRLKSGSTILSVRQASYDARGRMECEALRMNAAVFGSPPSSACTLGTAGANGPDRISKRIYDAASQITEITGAFGTAEAGPDVRYTYTDNGRQATVKDEKGNLTTYVYDGFDRISRLRYPHPTTLGSSSTTDYEQYTFNAVGRMTGHRVRSGQSIALAYDNLGRLTTRTPPSPQLAVTYSYDLLGRTTSASQTGHTVSYTYDALGRQLTEVSPQGTMSYQYDAAGRRIRATWPDSFYVVYDYDVVGAVTKIRENGATSGAGVLATYSYDNLGRLAYTARGNGVNTANTFNTASQLASMAHDLSGTAQDQTLSFTYNMAGQILTRGMTNNIYQMSGLSNLDHNFTVNGLDQYLTGPTSYTYDARGSLTSDGTRTYAYDFDNRLTGVTGVGGAVTLSYDPAGRLYQTAQVSGATARFLYDGANLAAEYNGSNVLQKRYVQGPGIDNPLVAYTGSGTTSKVWLLADERGSVVAETNASGTAGQINAYDEYGIPKSGNAGRFGYTGQIWIAEIEAYSYRNRVYHPRLGRFLQTDPIGQSDGLNLYAYVGNDPVNWTDPMGLWRFDDDEEDDEYRQPTVTVSSLPRISSFELDLLRKRIYGNDALIAPTVVVTLTLGKPNTKPALDPFNEWRWEVIDLVQSCFRANVEYSFGAQVALNAKTNYGSIGFVHDAYSWRVNAQRTYRRAASITNFALGYGDVMTGSSQGYIKEADDQTPLYAQPWQTVNDTGAFVGVDASAAIAIGVDLQIGFVVPSNGRC